MVNNSNFHSNSQTNKEIFNNNNFSIKTNMQITTATVGHRIVVETTTVT